MSDLAALMSLAVEFVKESPFQELVPETEAHFKEAFEALTDMVVNGVVAIAYKDDGKPAGAIGGYITPYWWRRDKLIALEMMWYVKPESRGSKAALKVLRTFESEAKAGGAHYSLMQAGIVEGGAAVSFLRRTGYKVQGPMCMKEL